MSTKKYWFRLDNTAKIFPVTMDQYYTTVFRISATLTRPIKYPALEKALQNTIQRYPLFKVTLKKGLFWYFWEENNQVPQIIADSHYPCRMINLLGKNVFPFRVRAYHKRIAVEFSHAITDGTGALFFLKTLLFHYFHICKWFLPKDSGLLSIKPQPELISQETEDSYLKAYKKNIPHPDKIEKAFLLPYKKISKNQYYITTGILNANEVIGAAKKYQVTITEFLVAVYLHAFYQYLKLLPDKQYNKLIQPIRIAVPVNLRKFYHSKTMKNFFLTITPSIDPRLGDYSFTEIIKKVHHYMGAENDEKYISRQIARNVEGELSLRNRLFPLFIKKMILKPYAHFYGHRQVTSALSNLGRVDLPDEICQYIERFDFIPNPGSISKIDASVISFQDKLVISFGKMIKSSIIEREFFRQLTVMGIKVKIETNR
ncbi:MAG: hypothetical protein MJB14_19475 [Spirochaetes bacterium]|nr:hypothetical protein [Spirochaetota bacterium]